MIYRSTSKLPRPKLMCMRCCSSKLAQEDKRRLVVQEHKLVAELVADQEQGCAGSVPVVELDQRG